VGGRISRKGAKAQSRRRKGLTAYLIERFSLRLTFFFFAPLRELSLFLTTTRTNE
jgi:hypothetical protein